MFPYFLLPFSSQFVEKDFNGSLAPLKKKLKLIYIDLINIEPPIYPLARPLTIRVEIISTYIYKIKTYSDFEQDPLKNNKNFVTVRHVNKLS